MNRASKSEETGRQRRDTLRGSRAGKRRRTVLLAMMHAGTVGAVFLSGCVTETRPSTPAAERSKPTQPVRPIGFEAQQMLLSAGVPSDADGNGFPDLIPITIYLFGDTRRYALPLGERGTFEFEVKSRGGHEIGTWLFPEEETANSLGNSAAGLCYRFALRLSPGKDRIQPVPVGLRAIFTNADTGQQIVSPGTATIRLGAGN